MHHALEGFGGKGLAIIALIYFVISLSLAGYLKKQILLPVPTGILATLAVAMVPIFVYGIQKELLILDEDTSYGGFGSASSSCQSLLLFSFSLTISATISSATLNLIFQK